ncbi:hypothetical protein AGMMS49982_05940 [Bacteroidia bacterium]|nr:hypothetical protein AGMMS49982_05940 [Bacteroidia bacterium]
MDTMKLEQKTPENIDEYIADFPIEVQAIMTNFRRIIHEVAPEVKEKISWGMPTFTLQKILVQFGGFKNHIGFFPGPDAIVAFQDELAAYKTSKGTIQLPYKQPFPAELVKKIVKWKQENIAVL